MKEQMMFSFLWVQEDLNQVTVLSRFIKINSLIKDFLKTGGHDHSMWSDSILIQVLEGILKIGAFLH